MDLPTNLGIALVFANQANPSFRAASRAAALQRLIDWAIPLGFKSREGVKLVVEDSGQIKCIATKFIPASKHLMHVPFQLDLTASSLKPEIVDDKNWVGWTEIKDKVRDFESSFQWKPITYDQKDIFTPKVTLALCILGILRKIEKETDITQHSASVQGFYYYWNALPSDIGHVTLNWTANDLACLQGSSFANCLPDMRRYGEELFKQVISPFCAKYPQYFGNNVQMDYYFYINMMIISRSFCAGTGTKEKSKLIPIVDLINGKPSDLHNATKENCAIQKEVNGQYIKYHSIEAAVDIYAGDEVFLEYASVGNAEFLVIYNTLPSDPELIMNNPKTEIYLDLEEFFETELLRMHPTVPAVRKVKREHVYGFFNLPKVIPLCMDDLLSSEYSCIPSLRQVFIFLTFNEQDAAKAIKTSRIKSQLNPRQLHQLFHMLLKFIECSLERPNLALFKSVITNTLQPNVLKGLNNTEPIPLSTHMRSAIFLQMSERLVVEVLINRFIHLFPETVHELGYTTLRNHFVSHDINQILDELCKIEIQTRQSTCMMCGNTQGVSKCSRCRKAYYCSLNCQKDHWNYHKKVCKPHGKNSESKDKIVNV
ncbi:zinc finger MYND domain-containing protein [archaeon]|nr:MAG: zinc finger MYND domain-containing protein [archaeon]